MIAALVIGAAGGLALPLTMRWAGMLHERSGLVILVCAVAVFYPVFAIASAASPSQITVHFAIAALFCAMAAAGFRKGAIVVIMALALHGLFDLAVHLTHHPAPSWWPLFCASFDIVAAGVLFLFLSRGILSK